jgi:hypothetical protein
MSDRADIQAAPNGPSSARDRVLKKLPNDATRENPLEWFQGIHGLLIVLSWTRANDGNGIVGAVDGQWICVAVKRGQYGLIANNNLSLETQSKVSPSSTVRFTRNASLARFAQYSQVLAVARTWRLYPSLTAGHMICSGHYPIRRWIGTKHGESRLPGLSERLYWDQICANNGRAREMQLT